MPGSHAGEAGSPKTGDADGDARVSNPTIAMTNDDPIEHEIAPPRPKRGPKRKTPWQGELGQFRGASPREAVTEAILDLVRRGELKPGMRLPSEPQLAEMTGISRTSVREAVRGLQSIGILEIRRGQGTFVSDINASSVIDAQMVMLLESRRALLDLTEVRTGIEPLIARYAAERATEDEINALRGALAEMIEAGQDHARWREAHLDFHSALASATQNIILMKIWGLIVLFLKDSPLVTTHHPPNDAATHEAIIAAVAAHDPEAAVAAMDIHITEMLKAID